MNNIYTKPFKTIEEQIEFLEERGLIIDDENIIKRYLDNISYYHLAVYMKPFQNGDDSFRENVKFKDILDLYIFDKKLRFLLLDMLERIEISLKNTLIYEVTKKTSNITWYADENNYELLNDGNHNLFNNFLDDLENKSKEGYIQHYYKKYSEPPYPPSWMFFESLSFGGCCKLMSILNLSHQATIAGKYSVQYKTNLKWLRALSFLRNVCAHHSRLWNRNFTYQISGQKTKYHSTLESINKKSLFAYLVVMEIYLKKFNPTSGWKYRLEDLIGEHNIDISKMGFPSDWKDLLMNL